MVRMGRDEILQRAREAVGERGNRYGEPEQGFERIAVLWNGWLRIRKDGPITGFDVAMMMMLFKVGRISANGAHVDSFVDACGYGACAGELATERNDAKEEAVR